MCYCLDQEEKPKVRRGITNKLQNFEILEEKMFYVQFIVYVTIDLTQNQPWEIEVRRLTNRERQREGGMNEWVG